MKPAVFLALLAPLALAETVTLNPLIDSDVYAFTDGPTSSVHTLGVSASGSGAPHSQRSVIKFGLGSLGIPAAEIESAVLKLYVVAPDSGYGSHGPGEVAVYRQGQSWSINSPKLRWSHITTPEHLGDIVVKANSVDKWLTLDVTAVVTAWVKGNKANHGFALKAASETKTPHLNVTFASMELASAGVAPRLVVTRTDPPPVVVPPVVPPVVVPPVVVPPVVLTPPVLSIGHSAGTIRLEWPVSGNSGWTLQTAPSPAGPWTNSGTTIFTVNDRYVATPPISPPAGFFRLMKP